MKCEHGSHEYFYGDFNFHFIPLLVQGFAGAAATLKVP